MVVIFATGRESTLDFGTNLYDFVQPINKFVELLDLCGG